MMIKQFEPKVVVLPVKTIGRPALTLANRCFAVFMAVLVLTQGAISKAHCPFCTAASQTLRQELQSMDAVAFGRLVVDDRTDIDGLACFKVEKVLTGESLLKPDQSIQATYFGPGKSSKRFLLMGVDPKDLVWSSPLPLSEEAEKYILKLQSLPEDPVDRLDFFQQYFEHSDSLLARDCYDEFALAPYSDVIKLKDRMNREQLLAWVQDSSKSPDRKRLYFTMLGVCGEQQDADLFETMITSSNPDDRAGLDALIAAFLTIRGEVGLPLIEKRFFRNDKSQYADIYSAVSALRMLGTEGTVLPKESITKTMHGLLERPDLADLVIPDLARWGDWSQVDKLCELFEKATDDNNWVRVPVVNYIRACPLPEAKEKLKHLEEIDPGAVKRAKTFFPIPGPVKKSETSYLPRSKSQYWIAAPFHGNRQPEIRLTYSGEMARFGSSIKNAQLGESGIVGSVGQIASPESLNPWVPMSVIVMASITLTLVMWLVATSGGTSLAYTWIPHRLMPHRR